MNEAIGGEFAARLSSKGLGSPLQVEGKCQPPTGQPGKLQKRASAEGLSPGFRTGLQCGFRLADHVMKILVVHAPPSFLVEV